MRMKCDNRINRTCPLSVLDLRTGSLLSRLFMKGKDDQGTAPTFVRT